jgi:hypothetical protein
MHQPRAPVKFQKKKSFRLPRFHRSCRTLFNCLHSSTAGYSTWRMSINGKYQWGKCGSRKLKQKLTCEFFQKSFPKASYWRSFSLCNHNVEFSHEDGVNSPWWTNIIQVCSFSTTLRTERKQRVFLGQRLSRADLGCSCRTLISQPALSDCM